MTRFDWGARASARKSDATPQRVASRSAQRRSARRAFRRARRSHSAHFIARARAERAMFIRFHLRRAVTVNRCNRLTEARSTTNKFPLWRCSIRIARVSDSAKSIWRRFRIVLPPPFVPPALAICDPTPSIEWHAIRTENSHRAIVFARAISIRLSPLSATLAHCGASQPQFVLLFGSNCRPSMCTFEIL